MKKILSLAFVILVSASAGFSQKTGENKPTAADKESAFNQNGVMARGAGVSVGAGEDAKQISLAEVLKKPETFAGKVVVVEGVIVRSCKMEGCWMELAPAKDAANSVRVTFKDHAFFIPLDAAGLAAKAKGVFSVKTLSKAQVEHLVNEDGAKFDNVNVDGTVTEIAFEATGVELTKNSDK